MVGLVETYTSRLGWEIKEHNVLVEGLADVEWLWSAAALYYKTFGKLILGDQIQILAAGRGDDGGVDGVKRIGLFDNDPAGRLAVDSACKFDRRLRICSDLFLLQPIMPLAAGRDHAALRQLFEVQNAQFRGLDWEIEDLLSERVWMAFEKSAPGRVLKVQECCGRKHRELTRKGKYELRKFAKDHALLEDLLELVKLVRALRDYCRLTIEHIQC